MIIRRHKTDIPILMQLPYRPVISIITGDLTLTMITDEFKELKEA